MQTVPVVLQAIRSTANQHRAQNLTIPQFRTLGFIAKYPDASLSEIADLLGLTLPSVSRTVDTLVQHGWLERKSLSNDRRQLQLKLKPAGQKVWERAVRLTQAALAERLATLSADQRARIAAAMNDLHTLFGRDAVGTRGCGLLPVMPASPSSKSRAGRGS